jgi:phage terminase large subunit GpA-like protein
MAENVVVFWIDASPAEIMFVSATEELLKKWAVKRLDPAINSCGARHKIFAQNANKRSKRSGDRVFSKEFPGGTLDMTSAQAAASLRSDSKRVLIRDEVDGAPPNLRSGEGNWVDVSYVRTNAWGDRRKVLDFSTPTTFADSIIYKEYLTGDRREFQVPCPHCGIYQALVWNVDDDTDYGLKADIKDGEVEAVFYLCRDCKERIYNHHKAFMLPRGHWTPTAKSSSKYVRSYHLSSLYSPLGMLSWEEIYRIYLDKQSNPDGMRSFVNLYLGMPYKDTGTRPKFEKVIELRGAYLARSVPDKVLFLTMAIDVQRGSKRDPKNPPRLEFEVCGHGKGFRTWSVLYGRVEGEIDDPNDGAWLALTEQMQYGKFVFYDRLQHPFSPAIIFIDSGDGVTTDIVYRFTAGWGSTFPTKGFASLRQRKNEGVDAAGPSNFRRYRSIKAGEDVTLYEVSTNFYKHHVYNNLKIVRGDNDDDVKAGFCDFPSDYGDDYFRMLTAEERRQDGSFYCPKGRRNEALDCRVLNLAACDVYLDSLVLNMRASMQNAGVPRGDLQQINHRYVLKYLENQRAALAEHAGVGSK